MCSRLQIVAFTPLYCRFIAALHSNCLGFSEIATERLSLSGRNCLIQRTGGAQ